MLRSRQNSGSEYAWKYQVTLTKGKTMGYGTFDRAHGCIGHQTLTLTAYDKYGRVVAILRDVDPDSATMEQRGLRKVLVVESNKGDVIHYVPEVARWSTQWS